METIIFIFLWVGFGIVYTLYLWVYVENEDFKVSDIKYLCLSILGPLLWVFYHMTNIIDRIDYIFKEKEYSKKVLIKRRKK